MIPMFSMESAISPAGDTDVMMAVVLSLLGLCLEIAAFNKVHDWTLRWLRKKAGGTKRTIARTSYPPDRTRTVISMVWGGIFTLFGLAVLIPVFGWFGIFWTLLAGTITGLAVWQFFVKKFPAPEKDQDDAGRQLDQLESLRAAGLMDDREYWEKREQILKEL